MPARSDTGKKVKAVVLTHTFAYYQDPAKPSADTLVEVPADPETGHTRGVEVEVPQAVFDRGVATVPPSLAAPKDAKKLLDPGSLVPNFDALTDEELADIVRGRGGDPKDLDRAQLETFVRSNTPTT